MDLKKKKELLGIVCIILGGIFILSGLIFFVVNNRNNLYGKKVSATVMSKVSTTTSDGEKITMLTLLYSVAGQNITTTYDYPGELEDGEAFITLYYDARNPKKIIQAGWSFEPLVLAFAGLFLFLLGLYYKGVTDFGIVEAKAPSANASEYTKKMYDIRQRIINGAIPMGGSFLFAIFGLVMVLVRHNKWMWIFFGVGLLTTFYFSLDTLPAILEFRQMKLAKKFKGQVVNTNDLGNQEKQSEENVSEEKVPGEDVSEDLIPEDLISEEENEKDAITEEKTAKDEKE